MTMSTITNIINESTVAINTAYATRTASDVAAALDCIDDLWLATADLFDDADGSATNAVYYDMACSSKKRYEVKKETATKIAGYKATKYAVDCKKAQNKLKKQKRKQHNATAAKQKKARSQAYKKAERIAQAG